MGTEGKAQRSSPKWVFCNQGVKRIRPPLPGLLLSLNRTRGAPAQAENAPKSPRPGEHSRANTDPAEISPPRTANPRNISRCPRAGKDLTKTFPEGILQQGSAGGKPPGYPQGRTTPFPAPIVLSLSILGRKQERKIKPLALRAALNALPTFGDGGSGLVPGGGSAPPLRIDAAGGLWALGAPARKSRNWFKAKGSYPELFSRQDPHTSRAINTSELHLRFLPPPVHPPKGQDRSFGGGTVTAQRELDMELSSEHGIEP